MVTSKEVKGATADAFTKRYRGRPQKENQFLSSTPQKRKDPPNVGMQVVPKVRQCCADGSKENIEPGLRKQS